MNFSTRHPFQRKPLQHQGGDSFINMTFIQRLCLNSKAVKMVSYALSLKRFFPFFKMLLLQILNIFHEELNSRKQYSEMSCSASNHCRENTVFTQITLFKCIHKIKYELTRSISTSLFTSPKSRLYLR